MNKRLFLVTIITTLLAFATSCKNETGLPVVRTKHQPDSDGIIRDIPEDKNDEYFQLMVHRTDSSLGLKPLKNGVKGLQIRIWDGAVVTYKGRLFLVEHNGKSWRGEIYYFRDSFVKQQYMGATLIEKSELKQSPRQWQELVRELFRLGVDTLPDYTQIAGYYPDMDGDAVLVEIAQNSFYKTYSYPSPSRREVKEAQQIVQIRRLIDKKFDNKLKDPAFGG